jgi:hypothetical protein
MDKIEVRFGMDEIEAMAAFLVALRDLNIGPCVDRLGSYFIITF